MTTAILVLFAVAIIGGGLLVLALCRVAAESDARAERAAADVADGAA